MEEAVINKLKDFFSRLTPFELIAIAVGLLIAFAVVTYGGDRFGAWRERRGFEQREQERMKKLQEALAKAEALLKSADVKDQKADQMGAVNEQKAKDAEAQKAQIEESERQRQDEINAQFERDKAYINSNLSPCERVTDICTRAASLGFACEPGAIEEACTEPPQP